jgi:D-glycero-D-manno-heptose 1,7-bisphosphate phosphatase
VPAPAGRKAVFLDRDGTIIVDRVYLNDPALVEYLPGAIEGLKTLSKAGYLFVVVTNQSGVPRGLVQIENLHKIHQRIDKDLSEHAVTIAGFYFAPYMTDSDHPLRKPNPGMLVKAAAELNIDLKASWMIGDRMLDVEAGHRAGCRSILVEGRETPETDGFTPPQFVAKDLAAAAAHILSADTGSRK